MLKRDVIDDLTDLVHPLLGPAPVVVGPDGEVEDQVDADAWEAAQDEAGERRRAFEENLRAAQDAGVIVTNADDVTHQDADSVDPVLAEIARAGREQAETAGRLRLLLAYAREFTPRAYSLADLARAASMSVSGVRTAYSGAEVGEITQRIHRPARDVVLQLRRDAGDDECAVLSGKRHQPATACVNAPTTIGGVPDTEGLFRVCGAHAWLVTDPHPITDPAKRVRSA